MLQKVLQGTGSPKLKAQALFVLAQSNSPRAREVLVNIAKGAGNPDLQMRAVRYLGIHGGRESRAALAEIYASSTDVDMKKRILSAFMQGGEKDRAARPRRRPSRTPSCAHRPCSSSATWARRKSSGRCIRRNPRSTSRRASSAPSSPAAA